MRFSNPYFIGGALCSVLLLVSFVAGYYFLSPPDRALEEPRIVHIPYGVSLPEAAGILTEAGVISRPDLLRAVMKFAGTSGHLQAGAYDFSEPQNLLTVARRLATGSYGLAPVRITFIEGQTAREYAEKVADAFPFISAEEFLAEAKPYEGYLFPDTYLFQPSVDAAEIVAAMRENFDEKIAPLTDDIAASGRTLSEIVIMASLIEKEARTSPNRHLVSGVLWNRIDRNMPLQVDAVFGYIFNRPTFHPSLEDLKVESPYNTYRNRGLPPGPIANPGEDSLHAAVHPTASPYLYYLTGNDTLMHYARTFEEHQENRRKYLR